jgi:L-asparaginase
MTYDVDGQLQNASFMDFQVTVHVIATGGTIASLADPVTGAVRPAVGAEELIAGVEGLDRFAPRVEELVRVNGWNVSPEVMLEVAARVRAAAADAAVVGVVVTHGTDTVEETAFLVDLLVQTDKPIAFAAAMRSGGEIAADGPRNLLNAANVAASPEARGLGAVLVLNDEIHAARWARKQDSFRASAFSSPGEGPLGFVTPGDVRVLRRPRRLAAPPFPAALDRPVPIVQTYTGMEEHLIEAVLDATGAAGLVLEGTGLGNVPGTAERGVRAALERNLPVMIATRVPTGGTGAVYGGPGGGVTLRDLGVIPAGRLPAAKARLLLMTLLAAGTPVPEIAGRVAAVAEVPG